MGVIEVVLYIVAVVFMAVEGIRNQPILNYGWLGLAVAVFTFGLLSRLAS